MSEEDNSAGRMSTDEVLEAFMLAEEPDRGLDVLVHWYVILAKGVGRLAEPTVGSLMHIAQKKEVPAYTSDISVIRKAVENAGFICEVGESGDKAYAEVWKDSRAESVTMFSPFPQIALSTAFVECVRDILIRN